MNINYSWGIKVELASGNISEGIKFFHDKKRTFNKHLGVVFIYNSCLRFSRKFKIANFRVISGFDVLLFWASRIHRLQIKSGKVPDKSEEIEVRRIHSRLV